MNLKSVAKRLVLRRQLKPVVQYNPSRAQGYNRAAYSDDYWRRRKFRSLNEFKDTELSRRDVLTDAAYCLDSMVEIDSQGKTPPDLVTIPGSPTLRWSDLSINRNRTRAL